MALRPALRAGLLWGTAMLALSGCSGGVVNDGTLSGSVCQPGQSTCAGNNFQTCTSDGVYQTTATCASGQPCDNTLGCVDCVPSSSVCAANNTEVHSCGADGKVGSLTASCTFGQTCSAGTCVDSCELAASEFVYLVDSTNRLLSFEPRIDSDPKSVKLIGTISCPGETTTPNSMGVDRHARAWVGFNSGKIYWVNPVTAACQASGFTTQSGFIRFGMGFVSDSVGARTESLYLGDGPNFDNTGLGRVDPTTLKLTKVANFPGTISSSPELTGTGAAELYGYFPSATASQHLIARINKASGQFDVTWPLPALPGDPEAWAFAHWGGRYYQFVTSGGKNQIRRYDPTTKQNVVVQDSTSYRVVGAGVSTCAPYIVG